MLLCNVMRSFNHSVPVRHYDARKFHREIYYCRRPISALGQAGLFSSLSWGYTSGEKEDLSVVKLSVFVVCYYAQNFIFRLLSSTFTKFYRLIWKVQKSD
jgi:hypothetical protein